MGIGFQKLSEGGEGHGWKKMEEDYFVPVTPAQNRHLEEHND